MNKILLSALMTLGYASVSEASLLDKDNRTHIATYASEQRYTFNNDSSTQVNLWGGANAYDHLTIGRIFEFCVEIEQWGADVDYTVRGMDYFTPVVASQVATLMSNTFHTFLDKVDHYQQVSGGSSYNNMYHQSWLDMHAYAGGIQTALWELIEDGNSFSVTTGDLKLSFDRYAPGLSERYAQDFLDNIASGSWQDRGGVEYWIGTDPGVQDRLFVYSNPTAQVPEAGSALLVLSAFGLRLMLRRRN